MGQAEQTERTAETTCDACDAVAVCRFVLWRWYCAPCLAILRHILAGNPRSLEGAHHA